MLLFNILITIALSVVGMGCGFKPLYVPERQVDIVSDFAQIRILPMKDRHGLLLHNELSRLLHTKNQLNRPRYTLSAKLSENKTSLGVKKSSVATRGNLNLRADYMLTSIPKKIPLKVSSNSITVSYNILSSEVSTLVAENNARKRAIIELAQEMKHDLGIFFKIKPHKKP